MDRRKKNGSDDVEGEQVSVTAPGTPPEYPDESGFDGRLAFRLGRHRHPYLRSANGKRNEIAVSHFKGKYSRSRLPRGGAVDVALDATLRAAAMRLVADYPVVLDVRPEDLREKIRRHRSPFAIVFVVDNSWSVQVEATLERTKGVVMELLKDARTHRDKVAMVAFRHSRRPDATVILPLTTSYVLATERLKKLTVAGSTPLPDALRRACQLLRQECIKYQNAIPVVVIVTDGLPNVSLRPGGDPNDDLAVLCRRLPREGIATIVVDTEPRGSGASAKGCHRMAALSKGKYLPISSLTRRAIVEGLRSVK